MIDYKKAEQAKKLLDESGYFHRRRIEINL